MRAVMTIALAALLTTPAIAGQQQDKNPKPPKEKKICRADTPTGSYIAKRTCLTAAEWQAIDGTNAGNTRAMLDKVGQPTGDGKPL